MEFLKYFKEWKKLQSRLKKSFLKRDVEISNLKESESEQDKKIAKLEGMMFVLLKQSSENSMQRSAEPTNRPVQTEEITLPIRLKKGYRKKQILDEMKNLSNQGYLVTEIEQAIVNKFGISRRTFYNYKKRLVIEVKV